MPTQQSVSKESENIGEILFKILVSSAPDLAAMSRSRLYSQQACKL